MKEPFPIAYSMVTPETEWW